MTECVLCHRDVTEYPSTLVDFEGQVEEVCDSCIEQSDEADERFDAEEVA